jgi:hypothetical protein
MPFGFPPESMFTFTGIPQEVAISVLLLGSKKDSRHTRPKRLT